MNRLTLIGLVLATTACGGSSFSAATSNDASPEAPGGDGASGLDAPAGDATTETDGPSSESGGGHDAGGADAAGGDGGADSTVWDTGADGPSEAGVDSGLPDAGIGEAATDSGNVDDSGQDSGSVHDSGSLDASDGGIACDGGSVACNGACVNEQADGNNCGTCGHDCLGGACQAGVCQPVVLAPPSPLCGGTYSPWAIALDSSHVYWTATCVVIGTGGGSVYATALAGGTVSTLAFDPNGAYGPLTNLVVDSTSAYWSDIYQVMSVPLGGGSPSTLTPFVAPNGIAVDSTSLYWTAGGTWNDVMSGPLGGVPDGGAPTTLASGRSYPYGLLVDTSNVYWTDSGYCPNDGGTCTGAVLSIAKGGGTITTLASGLATPPEPLAVDGVAAYFATYATAGAVMSTPLGGGTPTTLVGAQSYVDGIAIDTTYVYWTTSDGAVRRIPKIGGALKTVSSASGHQLGRIAVDGVAIYWTDSTSGDVMKVAK